MATRQDIINEIKIDLGHPTIKVELDDVVWDVLFSKSLRWFKGKKGLIASTTIQLQDGRNHYDWPTGALAITDVILPRRTDISDLLTLGFFDIIPAAQILGGSSNPAGLTIDSSAYVMTLQTLEMRRRIFSSEPDWYVIDYPIKKIVIAVKASNVVYSINTAPLHMIVFYKKDDIDVTDFLGRDEEMFYRYMLAKAKVMLGTIRSKYSTYPTAGGSITMDGDALKQEGFAEIERLEIEIDDSQGNAGGIVVG